MTDVRPGADAAMTALEALPANPSNEDIINAVYNPIAVTVLATQAQALAMSGSPTCSQMLAIRASAYSAGVYT